MIQFWLSILNMYLQLSSTGAEYTYLYILYYVHIYEYLKDCVHLMLGCGLHAPSCHVN